MWLISLKLSTITSDIIGAAPITVQLVPTDVPEMRKANGAGIEVAAQSDNAAPELHLSFIMLNNNFWVALLTDRDESGVIRENRFRRERPSNGHHAIHCENDEQHLSGGLRWVIHKTKRFANQVVQQIDRCVECRIFKRIITLIIVRHCSKIFYNNLVWKIKNLN